MDEPLLQPPTTLTDPAATNPAATNPVATSPTRRDDEPRAPHSIHESLERFGGAWLAAGSATCVAVVAVVGRVLV